MALSKKAQAHGDHPCVLLQKLGDHPCVLLQKLMDHRVYVSTTEITLISSLSEKYGLCPISSLISIQ